MLLMPLLRGPTSKPPISRTCYSFAQHGGGLEGNRAPRQKEVRMDSVVLGRVASPVAEKHGGTSKLNPT
jgi:hypothetical protein